MATPWLNEFRIAVEAAIGAGEFADQAAAEDALDDLATVARELAKAKPNRGRVMRKLKSATDILIESAEAARNAGGSRLAPSAAALMQLAQKLFET